MCLHVFARHAGGPGGSHVTTKVLSGSMVTDAAGVARKIKCRSLSRPRKK